MKLHDLNNLKRETEERYRTLFSSSDRKLPEAFKEQVSQFDDDRITYNDYSFVVQRSSEGTIYAPNQWLYIAAFYTSYCRELMTYKQELTSYLLTKYSSKKAIEEPIKACQNNADNAKALLENYTDNENKEYLIKFLSDYSWWGGAKTIDRSDFCVSAILSSAKLVNASQSYIADICEFLVNNPKAEKILLAESEHGIDTDTKQTSLPDNYAELRSNHYLAAIKTKPFLILGGFSGTGKSQKVKELAFMTCPNDELMRLRLGNTDNTPGNYCLVSVRPNWHDSSDLLGYYSSINDKYIVTDFVRFLVKAMQYEDIPFFVCLDEMNLAPVEEYFAEFLSVLESRKKVGEKILTDPLLTADWFNKKYKEYNIFDDLGLKRIGKEQSVGENKQAEIFGVVDEMPFDRMDIVEDLKKNGLRLPQNIIVIGTVNMDDTTNSFSRKVIDRAMTFETIVEEFGPEYYTAADTMTYRGKVRGNWTWILPDEVKASEALMHKPDLLRDEEKTEITNYINEVNACLKGSPFQIAYRILNETILYYRALWVVNHGDVELGQVFDDILMQKVLPRIEGDFDKTYKPLSELKTLAERRGWKKSQEKIDFMLGRFNKDDQGGFTSFWN